MWVFLNNAFLSIVADRDDAESLLVRARVAGDIERVFPVALVHHTPRADYAFRASVPREAVAARLAILANDIEYDNFKDSVRDDPRHSAYMGIWSVMHAFQEESK